MHDSSMHDPPGGDRGGRQRQTARPAQGVAPRQAKSDVFGRGNGGGNGGGRAGDPVHDSSGNGSSCAGDHTPGSLEFGTTRGDWGTNHLHGRGRDHDLLFMVLNDSSVPGPSRASASAGGPHRRLMSAEADGAAGGLSNSNGNGNGNASQHLGNQRRRLQGWGDTKKVTAAMG